MKGILLGILGAWLGGLAIPGIKLFLPDMTPFALIFVSNVGAIGVILIAKKIFSPGFKPFKKNELVWLAWALIIGSGLAVPLAIVGMVTVSGTVSGLLFNLEMFFTFYLAYFVFKEKLSVKTQLAMWLVFIGGMAGAFGGPMAGNGVGVFLIIGSCFFFGIQTNLLKKVESQDSFTMAAIEFFATWVFSVIFILSLGQDLPPFEMGMKVFFLGILTYAFGNVLFYQSLKTMGAAKTATVFGTSPLLGALSSFVILKEPLTLGVGLGILLVIAGLVLLTRDKKPLKAPTESW